MRFLYKLPLRLKSLFRRTRVEHELDDELRFHLGKQIEHYLAHGMSREDARYAALYELGGIEQIKEECRDMRRVNYIENFVQDLRYGVRILAENPGFTAVAVLVLGLGICASVTIFAFVDAALIKPLPYPNPARLVDVTEGNAQIPHADLSYQDYLDWKRLNKVFSSLDVYTGSGYLLKTPSGAQPVRGARVSDGFFRTLGITPMLGRDFYPGEDLATAPGTAVLSYPAWQRWFGGKRDVVGQSVTLSGTPYTVIGVLPLQFQFAPRGRADFWTTLQPLNSCEKRRSCHNLNGVARLKDGVSVQVALADLTSIAQQLEKLYPDSNRGQGASVMPLTEAIVGDIRPILLVLFGGAGLLVLIACVNVTSLLLARSESRTREIAVRRALGASGQRLVRQFATEGVVPVVAAGVLGLLSAQWAMQLLIRLIPVDMMAGMPYLKGLGLNLRVLAFAGAISLVAALLFALTPTLHLSLSDLRDSLAEGGRSSTGILWRRFGPNLVVVELAVAVVLLVGAGLLGKSLYRLLHVDLGFQPDHLAMLEVAAPPSSYGKDEQAVALGRQIISRIASLPGVQSVAITTRQLPLSFNGNTDWIRFVGRPYNGQHNEVNERDVSTGYFTTLQARLLRGRYFTDAEDASKPPVAIINQALARKYFPVEDPIGQKIGDTQLSPKSIKQIIGVVEDVREGPLDAEIWPTEYLPFNQSPETYIGIVVRTAQVPESVLPTLETALHQIDPDIGTVNEMTMTERINDSQASYLHRSAMWLVGAFAALALLLGVVGLYGVIAYSVSQRTREIGIRIALGAQRRDVMRHVVRQGGFLTGVGLVVGVIAALALTRFLTSLLYGVKPADPAVFTAVSAILTAVALLASYIPARRATKVDPMVALRHE
jgi:macrolide transport system ATP-binding/permease protein